MAKAKQNTVCNHCSNSTILNATMVQEEEGDKSIAVVVCGHHSQEQIEKTLLKMHENSGGLDIDIVSVELP